MTGPMDDEGVVDLLRAAGHGGGEPSPADVARAMTAGRKIRRRRQATQVLGSGLAIVAVLGIGITTVSALDDGGGTPVTTADDAPVPAVSAEVAREANVALLLETLGPDFRKNSAEEGPGATLRSGSPSAAGLPDGYDATASIWIGGPGDGYTGLGELCGELVEEGLRRSACVPAQTEDGRTVQVQTRRSVLKEGTIGGAYNMILVFFERSDGTVAEVRMQATDESAKASSARQETAQNWLNGYQEKFVALAADPRIQSGPPRTEPTDEPSNAAATAADHLADDMGDGWIRRNVTVVLDPDSDLASRLPQGDYEARTEAGIIDQAAFDQVCKARPGLRPCEERELSGDRTVFSRSWADRDIDGNMRGESAVYRAIGGDKYLLVAVSVFGSRVPEAERDAHVATLTEWWASVEEGLRKAVTDDRLTPLVVQFDSADTSTEQTKVSRCDSVPPPPGEYDSSYDPTTGMVTLTFAYAGNVNHSYMVDPRNDPTCDENADLKPFIDHITKSYEENR